MRREVPTINGIPVLLPPHEHPEFGTPGQHYHIDYRYCPDEPRQERVIHSDEKPVMLSFELVRRDYTIQSSSFNVVQYLSNKFVGKQVQCGKCPHKGLPVMNGLCTGHGMAFDDHGYPVQDYHIRPGPNAATDELYFRREVTLYSFEMRKSGHVERVELIVAKSKKLVATIPLFVTHEKGDTLKITIK